MEAGSSPSLVYIYQTIRPQIPADTSTELQRVRLLALRMTENNFFSQKEGELKLSVWKAWGWWRSGDMAPLLLNLDTRWRSVLNSTTRPLDLRRKELRLSKRLGGPQSGSRTSFDKSRSLSPACYQIKIPTCLAHSQVTIPTELPEHTQCRLIYFNVYIQYIVQTNKMHLHTVLLHSHTY